MTISPASLPSAIAGSPQFRGYLAQPACKRFAGRAAGSRDDLPHNLPPLCDQPSFVRHLDACGVSRHWYSFEAGTLRFADARYCLGHHDRFAFFSHENLTVGAATLGISHAPRPHLRHQTILLRFCPDALQQPRQHQRPLARLHRPGRPRYVGTRVAQARDLGEFLTCSSPRPAPSRYALIQDAAARAAARPEGVPIDQDVLGRRPATDLQIRPNHPARMISAGTRAGIVERTGGGLARRALPRRRSGLGEVQVRHHGLGAPIRSSRLSSDAAIAPDLRGRKDSCRIRR